MSWIDGDIGNEIVEQVNGSNGQEMPRIGLATQGAIVSAESRQRACDCLT